MLAKVARYEGGISVNHQKNLFHPPGYTAGMFDDMYKGEIARALRLSTILDILGDDYDLDRLRELVEADRDGRVSISPKVVCMDEVSVVTTDQYRWMLGRFMKGETHEDPV